MLDASRESPGILGTNRQIFFVALLALVVRGVWAAVVPVVPTSDCQIYDYFARRMAAGHGYTREVFGPTMYWPVGPVFLFSVCYRLFGQAYGSIVVLNLLLGLGSVVLTMLLARRWFGSPPSLVAGVIMALWPMQVEFTTILASETPFLTLMLMAWLALETDRIPWLGRSLLAGVLIAAASYIRPTGLLLAPVFLLGQLVQGRPWKILAAELIVIILVMAVCIAPWAKRNERYFGKAVWISANGGVNAWMGNHSGTNGLFHDLPESVANMGELERDEFLAGEARAFIKREPVQFGVRSLVKLVRLHERESIGITWNLGGLTNRFAPATIFGIKLLSNLFWWVVLALALAGLGVLVRDRGIVATLFHPAVLVWGYFAAVHAVTVVQDRYHYPILPSVAVLAGLACARLRPRRIA